MRIIHCLSGRLYTGKLPRSLRPSAVTSSLASTVPSPGHQFTGASAMYASRYESTSARCSATGSASNATSPGIGRFPRAQLVDELRDRAGAVGVGVVPRVVDLQEDPLRPAVVVDVGGGRAAARVVAEAERAQLALHVGDVRLGGHARVRAGLHRELLGREPERVVAHRVQHVEAGHAAEPRVHVGGDEAERVAHVQADTARVREHVEDEPARAVGHVPRVLGQQAGAVGRPEHVLGVPAVLPGVLDPVGQRRVVTVRRSVVGTLGHARERSGRAPMIRGYRLVTCNPRWGRSSVGRALAWHARGRGFDPLRLHPSGPDQRAFCNLP